ncbi:non-homologous end-joining DNA ligase [Gelria sp. Kuro-4]|uniref:non-homologous end-joining DNA ligase n=1 Tax=Gelria sp. Kuro-4 TaxID=2796927 RepID=UPI001C822702
MRVRRAETRVAIAGRELTLTNLDKVFWPDRGYTKADVLAYYVEMFPFLSPHLKDRPLVVTRYPNGIQGKSFYQKNLPAHAPAWIKSCPVPTEKEKRVINFVLCQDLPTLVWLVNQGALELHPWLSRYDKLDYPDFAVFDLDPDPPSGLAEAREVALVLGRLLGGLGLKVFPKTSGATGLHLYVPLARAETYEEVREFCGAVARVVARKLPALATVERRVAARRGKVYIDWLQNIRGQTICAPYSLRPLPGAPVSTPLTWDEVPTLTAGFDIESIRPRVAREGDLFRSALAGGAALQQAIQALKSRD